MSRPGRGGILLLFFLSGACGLVYEVVWMRMLTLVFGATTFATSVVLASFFAGLALGSLLFGRAVDRRGWNPLALYAVLEAGVGFSALAMPWVFAGLTEVYVALARALALDFAALTTVRFVLSFLVLLVPTTLMGGTLPVMVKALARREGAVGLDVGVLYAVNTFGAVVGTVLTGFFLILLLGVREASWVAAAVNLAVAVVVYLVSRRPGWSEPADLTEPAGSDAAPARTRWAGPARVALLAVGISGFCAMALEVLWTRALVFHLDNSTHAFTTMLTAFLLGIALGSAAIARFVDGRRRLLTIFGVVQALVGVSAILAIPVIASSAPVMERMIGATAGPWLHWQWIGMRFVTALGVMLVPTVLMGMTLPLVVRICTDRLAGIGSALGRVYFTNTIGGVLGSVAAGFLLIPRIGVHDGILAVGGLSVALGCVLVLAEPARAPRRLVRGAAVAGLALMGVGAALFAGDRLVLTSYKERVDGAETLFYREGAGSTVRVYRDAVGDRFISVDGFPVAGSSLGMLDAQQSLGNTPLLLTNVRAPRVKLIGFGAGGASWEVLQYEVSGVECVELVPAVLEAAPWLDDINHGVLDHPSYHAVVDDGRNHVLVSDAVHDVISIDATSPKMAGNGSLYTVEFYSSLRDRLSAEGMVVQWLPFHLLSDAEMRMTVRTFLEVFPHSTLWLSPIRHHGLLVGTPQPLRVDFQHLAEKMRRPGVRQELGQLRVSDAYDVLAWFVMGETGLATYAEGARVNSDNHPYLEFTPAMAYFYTMGYVAQNLLELARARQSPASLLVNVPATEDGEDEGVLARVERRHRAGQHTLRGDVLYYLGRREEAWLAYRAALAVDPEEKNWAHAAWTEQAPPTPIY